MLGRAGSGTPRWRSWPPESPERTPRRRRIHPPRSKRERSSGRRPPSWRDLASRTVSLLVPGSLLLSFPLFGSGRTLGGEDGAAIGSNPGVGTCFQYLLSLFAVQNPNRERSHAQPPRARGREARSGR